MPVPQISVRFDASDLQVLQDPYPHYRRSRMHDGLMRMGPGIWGVTRARDVAALLDADTLSSYLPQQHLAVSHTNARVAAFLRNIVLFQDPPSHGALRRMLAPVTGAAALRPVIEVLPTLFSEVAGDLDLLGEIDLMKQIATPLAGLSLAELLQLEIKDPMTLDHFANELSRVFGPAPTRDDLTAGAHAIAALEEVVERSLSASAVLRQICERAETEGIKASVMRDNLVFLLFAGFETTASMIGNTVGWILADEARQRDLRSGAVSVQNTVATALRDDPPIQGVVRVLTQETSVAGSALRAGRVLVLFVASANRDGDALFSFGSGRHKCPGADLAQAEIGAVVEWIKQAPDWMKAAGPATRNPDSRIRGYATLPVHFDVDHGT
ncbi:MAG: hypothetical protein QNJ09_10580 [Paracoccaceae bacterium]|nr:hypothetical protein [Paracoccaceae bacterium]